MEETTATLEKIQEAALVEFLDKDFRCLPAADRKERRSDYRGLLRLLLQQGGPV